jgi:hypothetical protein
MRYFILSRAGDKIVYEMRWNANNNFKQRIKAQLIFGLIICLLAGVYYFVKQLYSK